MTSPYKHALTTPKTQQQKAHVSQKQNAAGGYTFVLDPVDHLRRFLILGSEGGTFYASEQKHTEVNLDMVRAVIEASPKEAIECIVDVSLRNLAPKVDPVLAAFSIALCSDSQETRSYAYTFFSRIIRTGTHLFQMMGLLKGQRGWGRGLKTAVQQWYLGKTGHALAYQLLKYRQRETWTHRDVLRLAKPKPAMPFQDAAFAWVANKPDWASKLPIAPESALSLPTDLAGAVTLADETEDTVPVQARLSDGPEVERMILAFLRLQAAANAQEAAEIIKAERLPHECVPSDYRNSQAVWQALLPDMPYRALLRNLSTLSRLGVDANHDNLALILEKLGKPQGSRVHPITILLTALAYKTGRSEKGSSTWEVNSKILKALDQAFYAAFGEVQPTGLVFELDLDVSGSMDSSKVAGSSMSARMAAAAMACVITATEPKTTVYGFTAADPTSIRKHLNGGWYVTKVAALLGGKHGGGDPGLTRLDIEGRRLDDVMKAMSDLPMGGTDCSLPIRRALAEKRFVDVFVVMTDNETWAGPEHPHVSLEKYRKAVNPNAKLVVMAFTSTDATIANPKDKGMLDIVGLSADVPQVIRSFVS